MKIRGESKPLKQALHELLDAYRLNYKVDEVRLYKVWEEVVGEIVIHHTVDMKFYKGVVYLKLDSAALRDTMQYTKTEIIQQVNKKLNKNIIREIVVK